MSSHYNEQLMMTLIEHVKGHYPTLENLKKQLDLSLFSLLTPSVIQSIDNFVSANPSYMAEALTLKDYTDVISMFYGVESFSSRITDLIVTSRHATGDIFDKDKVLHPQIMSEYFTDQEKLRLFLKANPMFIGLYIFVIASM